MAKVVEAEAEVPKAIAQALEGNSVIDYYKLNNIQADTEMRDPISRLSGKNSSNNSENK